MINTKEAYFETLPQTERATAIRELAVTSYNKNVVRNFTEEELTEMKSELSEVDINLNDLEEEKKAVTAEINERIKPVKDARSILLKQLKDKYFENMETVYDIDDQEEGMMHTFDHSGKLLGSRRLTPKERQTSIRNLSTGTNE